jgi:hypothetical protein
MSDNGFIPIPRTNCADEEPINSSRASGVEAPPEFLSIPDVLGEEIVDGGSEGSAFGGF